VNKTIEEINNKKEEIKKKKEEEEKKKFISLNRIGKFIKLNGVNDAAKLKICERLYDDDKFSKRSDSSDSLMDFDVICNNR
jgi:hypothetical protein